MQSQQSISFKRRPDVCAGFGNLPTSTLYEWISNGLMTPGVRLGARLVAWPEHEISAIAAARMAGKGDDDIKALVKELVANRGKAMPGQEGGLQ